MMTQGFTAAELQNKTVEELRAMLADDTLLPLDDDSNTETILMILEVIKSKEHKTNEQREAERVAFWASLLVRHGDKIPVRLEDVVKRRGRRKFARLAGNPRRYHQPRKAVMRLALAAVFASALLICNAFAAYALNFNFLRAVVDFTDDLFSKTITLMEPAPGSGGLRQFADEAGLDTLQNALDELGITRPKAPAWLPDGFEFAELQTGDTRGGRTVAARYKNGDRLIVLTVRFYEQLSGDLTRSHEKSVGEPLEYERDGVVHYIFNNLDKTVATWVDGMCDCDIQGNISAEEMKSIINSMY
jgi:hypothetical protein